MKNTKKNYRIDKLDKKFLFKNNLGFVLKIINQKKQLNNIKEIYLTSVKKNKIKGWNMHLKCTIKLILLEGNIDLFILSKNAKKIIIRINSSDFKILTIYAKTKFAFKGLSKKNIFLSLSSGKYSKNESKKFKFE